MNRLKAIYDGEQRVSSRMDILDRTFKAWKEMAQRAEQTLGGLQAPENTASPASV